MAYNKIQLEEWLDNMPRGSVTTHGILAKSQGTIPRALAKGVCSSQSKGRLRVVMKGGWLPHPEDDEDCLIRVRFLKKEGLKVSKDNRRVIIDHEDMWRP